MSALYFNCKPAQVKLIWKVAERAEELAKKHNRQGFDALSCQMDLEATHCNGCPLDFDRLLDFDDFSFAHDVFGIERHLDRSTGKLKNHFLPRCAAKTEGE